MNNKLLHVGEYGITAVARELRDLQFGRRIVEKYVPLWIEYPDKNLDVDRTVKLYREAVWVNWDNTDVLADMIHEIDSNYWCDDDLVHDEFGDGWNGRPSKYITLADIERVCQQYGVDLDTYHRYFALASDERAAVRRTRQNYLNLLNGNLDNSLKTCEGFSKDFDHLFE